MSQKRTGCGCLVLVLIAIAAIIFGVLYYLRTRRTEEQLPPPSGGQMNVHVLDIGQGDSILIRTPSNKAVLIDAGNPGNGKKILAALNGYGVTQIELLVATHAHADHIGAADEVIKGIPVKQVLDSGVENDTKNYADFLEAIDTRMNAPDKYKTAEPGQRFDLGDGVFLTVLAPTQPLFKKEDLRGGGNEPNANSIITRLDYGEFSMLLTGDAEAQTEDRLIQAGARLEADVLKVGHHGSRYATSEDLIERGRFKDAVISDGEDNRYGHPSQDALDRLRAGKVNIYRTDLQGEITITSNGSERYQITTAREASTSDIATGRKPERDDSSRTGFIQYGDFGPARRPTQADGNTDNRNRNANRNANMSSRRNANNNNRGR